MVGTEARMRLSLVISLPPPARGTLKSTRIKTRLPRSWRSRTDLMLIRLCISLRREAKMHADRCPILDYGNPGIHYIYERHENPPDSRGIRQLPVRGRQALRTR